MASEIWLNDWPVPLITTAALALAPRSSANVAAASDVVFRFIKLFPWKVIVVIEVCVDLCRVKCLFKVIQTIEAD